MRITEKTKCKVIATEIEVDLRNWINEELLSTNKLTNLADDKTINSLKYKSKFENPEVSDELLINFADYGQCIDLISKNKKKLTSNSLLIYQDLEKNLRSMKNVRDRCAHGNLLANDIDETYLFIEKIKSYKSVFLNVFNELSNLLDGETIDSYYEDKVLEKGFEIENNLPDIEYDETGFIGRIKIKQRIDKTLNKNSIIVLTGDAGIGKTSLILDKCHEYKRNTNLFDEIKWFTFKTQKFSNNEIIELNKSLYASEYFESDKNKKDLTTNLIKYIQSKKCLLILDNLETVLDQTFKDFLDKTHEIDHDSKIIITSREPVDSGVTIKVEKFDNQEAESLFRKYSNYLSLENLKKLNSIEILKLNNQRDNNPLGIRLSLDDVYNGTTVEKAFKPTSDFLNYSYKKIYENLDQNSKEILEMMYHLDEEFTLTNICTYTNIEPDNIEINLQNLDKRRFIIRDKKKSGAEYFSLRAGIKKFFRVNNFFVNENKRRKIIQKHSEIKTTKSLYENNSNKPNEIRHDWDSFYKRKDSDDEAITELLQINRYILDRVRLKKDYNFTTEDDLKDKINKIIHKRDQETIRQLTFLKKKHKDYCEVYRVEGVFYGHIGAKAEMKDAFYEVFRLAPDYPNPRAYFIERLRDVEAFDESLKEGIEGLKIFPENIEIKLQLLKSKYYLRDFDQLTIKLANEIKDSATKQVNINYHFARKLANVALEFHRRYAEFLIFKGGDDNHNEAFNQVVMLADNFNYFEKLELIDYQTTKTTLKKSFGELDNLKAYFREGEKIEIIFGLYDVFKSKLRQYMGASISNARRKVADKYLTNEEKDNKNLKELKEGDIHEGIYLGSVIPNNRKFTNFIGGYINLDSGYFKDINGLWKKKIFIHNSQNIVNIKSGTRLSFQISKFKNSLVAINPKVINK